MGMMRIEIDENERTEDRHAANIGKIVLHLRGHEPGDWGDCSVNHPLVGIVDAGGTAAEFVVAIGKLSEEDAAGIVAQL